MHFCSQLSLVLVLVLSNAVLVLDINGKVGLVGSIWYAIWQVNVMTFRSRVFEYEYEYRYTEYEYG